MNAAKPSQHASATSNASVDCARFATVTTETTPPTTLPTMRHRHFWMVLARVSNVTENTVQPAQVGTSSWNSMARYMAAIMVRARRTASKACVGKWGRNRVQAAAGSPDGSGAFAEPFAAARAGEVALLIAFSL